MNGIADPRSKRQCLRPECTMLAVTRGLCTPHYLEARDAKKPTTGGGRTDVTDELIAKMRKLRSQFKSNAEIARQLGISPKTVQRHIERPKA